MRLWLLVPKSDGLEMVGIKWKPLSPQVSQMAVECSVVIGWQTLLGALMISIIVLI